MSKRDSKRGSASKKEVPVFCDIITEMTSCQSGCILFIRSKTLGPAHSQVRVVRVGSEATYQKHNAIIFLPRPTDESVVNCDVNTVYIYNAKYSVWKY